MRHLCCGIFLSLITTCPSYAHDFWIEPSSFRPAVGEIVRIRLRVGEHFLGDPVPRNPESIISFVAWNDKGSRPIAGLTGKDPAGLMRTEEPGLIVLGYSSRPQRVDLPADKFEAYLLQEGLEKIIQSRASEGEQKKPGMEIFSRSVKSLVVVGGKPTGASVSKPLGMALELLPENDLYRFTPGATYGFRLLFRGKPLEGALVIAMNRENPAQKLFARSTRDGRVRLKLERPGDWIVKAVNMTPAPAASGAQWESFWATITFRMDPPASEGQPRASR